MVNDNIIGRQRPSGYDSWNSAMDQAAGVAPAEFAAYTCNEEIVERFARSLGGENIRPSMLIAPSRLGSGVLRAQIPDNLAFTVTNGTSPNVNGSTRVGPNGLIETAKTNLFLQSAGFEVSAVWSPTNTTVTTGFTAPDNSTDADLITTTSTSSSIGQNITVSGTYTISVFAKAGNYGLFRIGNVASVQRAAWFDLNAGVVTGTVNGGTASMQNYGNGWYRCIYTSPTMASGLTFFAPSDAPNSTSAVIGSSIYLWGAQLEVGSSASEYIPTTTIARTRFAGVDVNSNVNANAPRLDYFGQSCPGLLVEASAQNLALQSAGFQDLAVWSRANILVTTGFTALDGSTDADLLTATSSGSARIAQSFSFVSGTTYTYSAFAKAGSDFFGLTMENGGVASGAAVIWNLKTGALAVSGVAGSGYTLVSQGIENYGNGWYRCRMTVLMSVSVAGNIRANTSNGTMTTAIIQSDNGNNVYVWGAQLETGSIATSYIPTTTSAVTRNADVISASGVSGLIGQTEGTIYVEVDFRSTIDTTRSAAILEISDGLTNSNLIRIFRETPNFLRLVCFSGGSLNVAQNAFTLPLGVSKIAVAYQAGSITIYLNGAQKTYSTFVLPLNMNNILFLNTIFPIGNIYRAVALYTTRLSNEQLMLLTSPTYYGDIADMSWSYYLNRSGESVPSCLQTRNYQLLQV